MNLSLSHNRNRFEEVVSAHQGAVRRFLLNLTLGNEALADDLAQDTFLKAYQRFWQFRGESQLQTWLLRIAYNTFYDYRRAHPVRPTTDVATTMAAAQRDNSELRSDVHRALAMLKDEERTCITLQYIEGHSIDEIAAITRMPANTVKSHLHRGKEKMRTFLKANGYD